MKQDYHQPLVSGEIYHVFSRAVGYEKIFKSDENYLYFLQKLKQHTSPVCDI
jgi:putative transposase